jgi:hypothetical protein
MKNTIFPVAVASATIALLTGCVGLNPIADVVSRPYQADQKLLQERLGLGQKFNSNPDTDAWNEQRQKIAQATGDRVFEKDYGRVFDSLTLAVSTMELKVNNMERQSGYIAASGISLPPSEAKAMRREAVNDWCRQNGFDASILDRQFRTDQYRQINVPDLTELMAKYEKMQKGLTFQLIKIGENQTKVKLRFSDVYYPAEVETYYKLVWQAVDKQIFVDQNIEGAVEKRK